MPSILSVFKEDTCLYMNKIKFALIVDTKEDLVSMEIRHIYEMESIHIYIGFIYLGFTLKSNKYVNHDYEWLLEKFDKELVVWQFKWLSLGGRLILIKFVLQNMFVYWMHFYMLPMDIIQKIDEIIACFLWFGNSLGRKIHLV